ncbi:MAG: hypothetical protein RI898_829 [Actinomycetota bacterium]
MHMGTLSHPALTFCKKRRFLWDMNDLARFDASTICSHQSSDQLRNVTLRSDRARNVPESVSGLRNNGSWRHLIGRRGIGSKSPRGDDN